MGGFSRACTREELARALAAQAAREPQAGWVRGAGWDETVGGLAPDRHTLDALGLDRPVIVAHYSLHQCVVSSQALDELGIGRTTPDPPGGTIERGPDGEPTGVLVERAWSEAHARSLAAYGDPARWGGLIAARARVLLADGITCVHDAACPPSAESVYRTLAGAGALPISVLMMPDGEALLTPPSAARSSLPHRARYPRLARTACGDGRPRGDRRRPARIPPPHGPAGGRLSARAGDLVALRRDGPRRPSARRLVRRSVRVPRAAAHLGVRCHARTGSGGVLGAEQALGYEEWLRAYTAGAAYAGGQEDERGSITPGKRADLVVVEGDLHAEHPPRVVETWVAGERV